MKMVKLRATLSIILAILFLKSHGKSTSEEERFPLSLPNPYNLLNDLQLLSNTQNNTMPNRKESNGNDTLVYTANLHVIDVPLLRQLLSKFEKSESNDSKTEDFFVLQPKFLEQTFRKGEQAWLKREKEIESLWLNKEGADPKSSLGTAFAFNAPNPHSLWVSNTSVFLEFASRAFIQSLNEKDAQLHARTKRHSNFLQNDFSSENRFLKVDITPFVPAHEYIAKCGVSEEMTHCDASKVYRTYSGWCNNLRNPSWGKSVLAFDRMLPPVYDDGISVPRRRSVTGNLLPSPRHVSSTVHVDVSHLSQRHTLMFMQFAQFLDHDITFTPVNKGPRNSILNCRECDSMQTVHPECWPIPVPATDSYYPAQAAAAAGKGYCIPFTRSLAGQQHLGPREQINQNSAYLDSSQIYGENYCKAMSLRSGGGMLNVTFNPAQGGKVLMPQVTQMQECRSPSGYCFYAGDPRASEQPALASVHTIFLREHNRLAEELHVVNPHWSDDKLYQETRRILTAMNQHVIYSEFLPRLIGPKLLNAYGLRLQNEGYYASYDANCQTAAYNEFAAAAFRFGHSLIRPQLARMDSRYNGMSPHIPLRDGFFNSDMLYKSLMVDEVIRGLLAEPMEQMDPFITKEITNHLFEDTKRSFSGMDLIALNLHRARDHGLQGYNSYRAACDLPRAMHFRDLQSEISSDVISRLQQVYEHVDDIDLFTGSLVENAVNGGLIGPTMSCIIGNQFKRIRQCDRFWYETNDHLLQFTPMQLAEIRKATLSKIICNNFDVPSDIQKNAFDAPHNFLATRNYCEQRLHLKMKDEMLNCCIRLKNRRVLEVNQKLSLISLTLNNIRNPRLPCNRLPTTLLEAWREKRLGNSKAGGCKIGNRGVPVGEGGLSSPCVSCICTPEGTKCASLKITSCARLSREARIEDILKDEVCTSQCGLWLGIRGSSAEESQHNDLRLQVLQPPSPLDVRGNPFSTNSQTVNNLFNIINGRIGRE